MTLETLMSTLGTLAMTQPEAGAEDAAGAAEDAATGADGAAAEAETGIDVASIAEDPQAAIEALTNLAVEYGPKIVLALAMLIAGFIVAGWIGSLVSRAVGKANVDQTLSRFIGTFTRYGVLLLVILSVLQTLGVETTSFAAVIAAMGFAVGLALQGTLSNFASGVMLLFFRPFNSGQFIKVAGEAGTVEAIGLFTTTLDTPDKRRIILPNSSVFGNTIENVSHHPIRRIEVAVGTAYDADLDKTREVLLRAIDTLGGTVLADPPKSVFLNALGDSAIDWRVRAFVNAPDYWDAMDALTRAVKVELDKDGIGIPFPQTEVTLFKAN
ncbi:MAG: mechanosensitive ion channel domain-containing protein [Planctomycetota bacterium]